MAGDHPLLDVLTRAAQDEFPPVDGKVDVLPPDAAGTWAIVEFTGHAYVLGDVSPADLAAAGADGFGGAGHPDVARLVAGPDGFIGCHDAVLVAPTGADDEPLPLRTDADSHPRVERARHHRRDVIVFGDVMGVVPVGRGLAGRLEMAVELTGPGSNGAGRRLIQRALASLPAGEWCYAQVSPGNAASLRAFLGAGFKPIASEMIIYPSGGDELGGKVTPIR